MPVQLASVAGLVFKVPEFSIDCVDFVPCLPHKAERRIAIKFAIRSVIQT
jgi:hypothetical protein